jgi:hypothetical protein
VLPLPALAVAAGYTAFPAASAKAIVAVPVELRAPFDGELRVILATLPVNVKLFVPTTVPL